MTEVALIKKTVYLADLQASFLLFLLTDNSDRFFLHDWLSSRSLILYDFIDGSRPGSRHCVTNATTARTVETREV